VIVGKGFGQSDECVATGAPPAGQRTFLYPTALYLNLSAYGITFRMVTAGLRENCDFLIPDSGLQKTDDWGCFPIDQTATTIYHAR